MSQARLEALVRQYQPLLAQLLPGARDIHYAALWGQTEQESNANPVLEERKGSSQYGIGLWQWSFDRHNAIVTYAQANGKDWTDVETQVRYLAKELGPNGIRAEAWRKVQLTTTLRAAVETAMAYVEAPAKWQEEIQNPGTTTAGMPRRLQGATWALAVIQSLTGEKKVSDQSGSTTTVPTKVDPSAQGIAAALEQFMPVIEQKIFDVERKLAQQQGGLFPMVEPLLERLEDKLIQLAEDEIKRKLAEIDIGQLIQSAFGHLVAPHT